MHPTHGAMWTFLVLTLLSPGATETARCQKNGAPVFLQFGTRFRHGSVEGVEVPSSQGDPDDFPDPEHPDDSPEHPDVPYNPEEHPDVPHCYGSFGAVAAEEGESVGSGMKDASLADCKRACDSQEILRGKSGW